MTLRCDGPASLMFEDDHLPAWPVNGRVRRCAHAINYPVDGELISYAAIGVWYNPRQCLRHRYESRLIDVGP